MIQTMNSDLEKRNSAVFEMISKNKIAILNFFVLDINQFFLFSLNFLIVDEIPLHEVENEGFKLFMSNAAPHLKTYGRTFYTMLLEKEFASRQQQLKQVLFNCSDAATTIDAWTCSRSSDLGETVHWFDKTSVKRKSACLACRRIKGRHTHDVLAKLIESIHENQDKLRGSTTDNGSNFIKCFREKGASSTLPNYEEDDNQDYDDDSEDEETALVNRLLDTIHFRFDKMFTDNELRLATITNPMLKLSWLEKDEDIEHQMTAVTVLHLLYLAQVQKSNEGRIVFASITKKRSKKRSDDEIDNYLNLCDSLDKLYDFPIIQQIYKQYVDFHLHCLERLFSQGGLIYSTRRMKMTDIHFEMLLFLKVNNKIVKDWSSKMFTLSDVLSDWRYFDVAIVRFAEIVFRNPVSRYRRLNVSDRRLFVTLLNEAKETGTFLDFTPFSGEVWELDFYYRLLWWLEPGEDVYHPTPRHSDFHPEVLFSTVEARLAARLVAQEVLNLWGENM
ncbi:Uncharacterized protein APZ42_021824 [Daphnia magna]|uniref:Uncharacterized protein n=1 Tax=Daphnia magna TaxID=35525 RepID=A0A162C9D3_9CRUS|nr:Uncharacterized protein APZ42_021824 [Daphnia magna]